MAIEITIHSANIEIAMESMIPRGSVMNIRAKKIKPSIVMDNLITNGLRGCAFCAAWHALSNCLPS